MKNITNASSRTREFIEVETIESLLKRLNKTTIYVIVDSIGVVLLYPKVVGNTIMYNMLNGHVIRDGDLQMNKIECNNARRVDSNYAMQMVDHAVSRDFHVDEIVVEGYSELEPCGELEWEADKEHWKLTWN